MTTPAPPADRELDEGFAKLMDAFQDALAQRNTAALTPDQAAAAQDFLEIRDAFALLRRELDLPPFAGPINFPHAAEYHPNQLRADPQQPGPAIQLSAEERGAAQGLAAAAGGTVHIVEVDAQPWGQPDANADRAGADSGGITPVGRALAAAGQYASAYRDAPEWQRIQAIRAAFGGLADEIRKAAGSYYRELLGDVRAQGFLRAITARTCHAISQASKELAGRIETSGHRASPAWTAAWNLHRATANRASQLTGQLPKGHSLDIVGDISAIMDTMRHRIGDSGPGAEAAADAVATAARGLPLTPGARLRAGRAASMAPAERRPDRGVAAGAQHER
jgi:hypothetical protein